MNWFHNGILETKILHIVWFLCWTSMLQKQTVLWHTLCNFTICAWYEDGPLILKHVINQATILQLQNWPTYTWLSVFDWHIPYHKILKYQLTNIQHLSILWFWWQYTDTTVGSIYFWTFVHTLDSGGKTTFSNWAHFCCQDEGLGGLLLSVSTVQQNKWTVTASYLYMYALRTLTQQQ